MDIPLNVMRKLEPMANADRGCGYHLPTVNQELQVWEHVYNTLRPHQALGYLSPHQFVTQWQ